MRSYVKSYIINPFETNGLSGTGTTTTRQNKDTFYTCKHTQIVRDFWSSYPNKIYQYSSQRHTIVNEDYDYKHSWISAEINDEI